MGGASEILIFEVAGQRYGAFLADVVEVLRAATISRLPKAPPVIAGVLNVRGTVVPVIDIRIRFGLPEKQLEPADQFIVVRTQQRVAALHVDRAIGLFRIMDADVVEARDVLPSTAYIVGVAKLPDGLTFIYDLDAFLSQAESEQLAVALTEGVVA